MKKLTEFIKKIDGGFRVISHQTGKNFGTYPTKAQAEKRLRQIHRFAESSIEIKKTKSGSRYSNPGSRHSLLGKQENAGYTIFVNGKVVGTLTNYFGNWVFMESEIKNGTRFSKTFFNSKDAKNWILNKYNPQVSEKIEIPVEKGDTILGGRFKNHPIKVKSISKDDWDMPTVNGRKVVNFRIPKKEKDEAMSPMAPQGGVDASTMLSEKPCECGHDWALHNQVDGKCSWCDCESFHPKLHEDAVQWSGLAVKQTPNGIIWYNPKTGDVVKWVQNAVVEQKDEEDYPLDGKIYWKGILIDVENARGSTRKGVDGDGHKWESYMYHHYGRIRNTEAVDGDMLDVYVGPSHDSEYVYKVKQLKPDTGEFDENKYMLGFESPQEAYEAYQQQYDRPDFFGGIESIPFDEFKQLVHQNQKETVGNK